MDIYLMYIHDQAIAYETDLEHGKLCVATSYTHLSVFGLAT